MPRRAKPEPEGFSGRHAAADYAIVEVMPL